MPFISELCRNPIFDKGKLISFQNGAVFINLRILHLFPNIKYISIILFVF